MISISIITTTYNAADTIEDCLKSVASQTYPCEQLIIDGASVDRSLEIAAQFAGDGSRVARIVSEPDGGMYDAMNKGIGLASGEVIGILNADDFYASPTVLEMVAQIFEDATVMSCYGDLEYVKERGAEPAVSGSGGEPSESSPLERFAVVRYWKSGAYQRDNFYWGWMPPHPTFFVRKSVYERYGCFNLDQGSAADYELMLRLLFKERISCSYLPEVLVRMRVGGASNATLKARIAANRMDRRAWRINGLRPLPWTIMMKPLRKLVQYVRRIE